MSATTASPSEFPPSPGFIAQNGNDNSAMMTPGYGTPYGGAFLSPMVNAENGIPTSVSPLPFSSAGEPSIVEQSPPMGMMGRHDTDGLYGGQDGSCAVSEDGTNMNDMYSKHNLNLPMHTGSPGFVQSQQAELDMESLVQFDTVDPASLSPEGLMGNPQ